MAHRREAPRGGGRLAAVGDAAKREKQEYDEWERKQRTKDTDSELGPLPLDVLRSLYRSAIDQYWDMSIYDEVLEREAQERAALQELASGWEPEQQ